MSLHKKVSISILLLSLGVCSATALAQQQQQPNNPALSTPGAQGGLSARRGMRRRARRERLRALEQINLSDAQRQQLRTIMQTQAQTNKPQRDELRQLMQQWRAGTITPEGQARAKALRGQLLESRMGVHSQIMGVLTPEQKTKLQELREARRANHLWLRRGRGRAN